MLGSPVRRVLALCAAGLGATSIGLLLYRAWSRGRCGPPLPPGPRGWPLLGCVDLLSPDLYLKLTEMGKEYGDVFSFYIGNRLTVVLNSACAIRAAFVQQPVTFAGRPRPWVMELVGVQEDVTWKMPRATITKPKKAPAAKGAPDPYVEEEAIHTSEQSSEEIEEEPQASKGRKRSLIPAEEDEAGGGTDYSNTNEMQRMLECFGGEIFKARVAKKKRLETYTTTTLKTTNRRVDDIWKGQQVERQKLHDEFSRQVVGVFAQWEGDVDKTKDQEEKLTNMFRQQQKLFQQTRIIQSQRLKTLKQLHDEYIKGLGNLAKCHQEQQATVQGEMKREMLLLQKKILMDTQQQEVASFKKSLQNMLY